MKVLGHCANTPRWVHIYLKEGAHGVELDVYDQKGEIVVGHRLPNERPRLLRERFSSLLTSLHITRSMRLSKLLSILPNGSLVMLDLKTPVDPSALVREVEAADIEMEFVVVSTRYHDLAEDLSKAGFRTLLSIDHRPSDPALLIRRSKAHGVSIRWSYADPQLVNALVEEGFSVALWTINSKESLEKVLRTKANFIITDYPAKALKFLASSRLVDGP